jgi:hypothetical protein
MQHSMLISSPFKNAPFDQAHQKTIGDRQNFARSSVRRFCFIFLLVTFFLGTFTLILDFCKKFLLGHVGTFCLLRMKMLREILLKKKNVFSYVNVS